jgi:dGTP triphosphohydrolase
LLRRCGYNIKQRKTKQALFDIFFRKSSLNPHGQYNIKAPALYERIQAVLDYISGMTDVFALDLYRKINGNSLPAV